MKHEKLQITAVDVRGFKRIDHVHVETEDHRNILLIAGKNRQGKSSLMDALDVAFTGGDAIPPEPIKFNSDGSPAVEASVIKVELNDGEYEITRIFKVGKEGKSESKLLTTLTVKGPDGKLSSPQSWLDNLVAQRFLDPLKFLSEKADKQRKILLDLIGVDVDKIQAEYKRVFDQRTEENRFLKQAKAQLEGIEALPPEPASARPMEEIQTELDLVDVRLKAMADAAALHTRYGATLSEVEASCERRRTDIIRLREQLAKAEADLATDEQRLARGLTMVAEAKAKVPAIEELTAANTQRAALKAEQLRVSNYVQWTTARASRHRQIEKAETAIASHEKAAGELTAKIQEILGRKERLLAEAKMPIEGLEVTETGLRLGGAPLEQASQAEQLRCSLAIAIAQSPRFRDIWVKNGSLLDEEGIEALRLIAQELDCRVWLEVVNERPDDDRAIIIRDGKAVGQVVAHQED